MSKAKIYNVREARASLPQMIDEVLGGEHVIVRRATDGAEVELVPRLGARVAGRYKDRIRFAADAFEPLSEDELAHWEGGN